MTRQLRMSNAVGEERSAKRMVRRASQCPAGDLDGLAELPLVAQPDSEIDRAVEGVRRERASLPIMGDRSIEPTMRMMQGADGVVEACVGRIKRQRMRVVSRRFGMPALRLPQPCEIGVSVDIGRPRRDRALKIICCDIQAVHRHFEIADIDQGFGIIAAQCDSAPISRCSGGQIPLRLQRPSRDRCDTREPADRV
ncbi:MAG: hypothetical protein WDO24_26575 [Pseudomonadota bacterium]